MQQSAVKGHVLAQARVANECMPHRLGAAKGHGLLVYNHSGCPGVAEVRHGGHVRVNELLGRVRVPVLRDKRAHKGCDERRATEAPLLLSEQHSHAQQLP